ncbi:MAG TPA: hypothetical protein VEW03_15655 [Longimicrobiaceae bacterium]|nr:hypothetical protein [Longimicrobiaceae bacterium]
MAKQSNTTTFRYVLPTASGEIAGAASCVIPGSQGAIALTARFFRLAPDQVRPDHPVQGEVQILCGTEKDACPIAGVTGTAKQLKEDDTCDPTIHFGCEDDPGGAGDGTVGGDSWGEDTGSDDDDDPEEEEPACTPDANGTVCETEDRPECKRVVAGSDTCVTRDPTEDEWERLKAIIDRMTTSSEYCRGAKEQAQAMYAAGRIGGRIRLWDGRNYEPGTNQKRMIWGRNGSDERGRTMELDSYLAFSTRSLVAHESLHAYLSANNVQMSVNDQETWVRAKEEECAG